MRRLRNNQGAILAIAMMTAMVASIFAYSLLALSVSQGQQARFFRGRTQARYLGEAGMVIAQARLLNNLNTFCTPTAQLIDTSGDGILQATEPSVTITVTPGCPRPAGSAVTIQVRVNN